MIVINYNYVHGERVSETRRQNTVTFYVTADRRPTTYFKIILIENNQILGVRLRIAENDKHLRAGRIVDNRVIPVGRSRSTCLRRRHDVRLVADDELSCQDTGLVDMFVTTRIRYGI